MQTKLDPTSGVWLPEDQKVSIEISEFQGSYSDKKQTTTECQESKELTGPTTPKFNLNNWNLALAMFT